MSRKRYKALYLIVDGIARHENLVRSTICQKQRITSVGSCCQVLQEQKHMVVDFLLDAIEIIDDGTGSGQCLAMLDKKNNTFKKYFWLCQ